MSWEKWIKEKRFTLYRTAIIQRSFIDLILAEVSLKSKVLETGVGSGTTLVLLEDLGYNMVGFDYSELIIEKFKERFPHLADKVYIGNILDEKSYKEKYEAIIHQGVLEHFSDDEIIKILNIQARNSKKIIFDVPNNQREKKEDEGGHTRFEPPEFLGKIVSKAGLKFKRFGRNSDWNNDLIPEALKRYDSPLMKKIGRSSMFVCWKE